MSKIIMVQGTSSGAGKSFITTAICRFLKKKGFNVAPYKAQNMSLNAVAVEEGEMAWAQFVQALACEAEPSVLMNPVLLKPVGNSRSELILLGKSSGFVYSATFDEYRKRAKPVAYSALRKLMSRYDVIVAEGAGSPAEINIKEHDYVNMMLAKTFDAPVLLVADIERGGVFAQIVGTMELLDEEERRLIEGFIINKFRGNPELLKSGLEFIKARTQKEVLAVIPYAENSLPPEDSLDIRKKKGKHRIAVIKYPRISNFSDLIPLWIEDVEIVWVTDKSELQGARAVILPGSRRVLEDLRWMKEKGIYQEILNLHQRGTFILGICGGFQMLSKLLVDETGSEGGGTEKGLSIVPAVVEYTHRKQAKPVKAVKLTRRYPWIPQTLKGYIIKAGRMHLESEALFRIGRETDGYARENLMGTHIHNILWDDTFRSAFMEKLGIPPSGKSYQEELNRTFDDLAEIIEREERLKEKILELAQTG